MTTPSKMSEIQTDEADAVLSAKLKDELSTKTTSTTTTTSVKSDCCSSMSASFDEVIISVPEEMMPLSLGFSIDAGGSVTKLVYRSKDDYDQGKPRQTLSSGQGRLRLRYFDSDNITELIKFLKDHCDIFDSSRCSQSDDGDDDRTVWYQTGVGYQHFKTRIEQALNIQTKMLSEMDGSTRLLHKFYFDQSASNFHERPLPLATRPIEAALNHTRSVMSFLKRYQDAGDKSIGKMMNKPRDDGFSVEEYAMKVMTSDGASMAQELSVAKLQYPFVFVIIGSALALSIFEDKDSMSFGDFLTMSGKTFLMVGKTLTGAKSFDELVDMASRGDSSKLDILAGDMKCKDDREPDWYNMMMDEHVIFSLGKLGDEKYKGAYAREDIAAALVRMFTTMIVKTSLYNARLNKVKLVVLTGSYLCHPFMKEMFEEIFYKDAMMLPFSGGDVIRMAILPNPGFLCALGTWLYNWEQEQERNTTKNT